MEKSAKTIFSAISGFIIYFLGGWDGLIVTLLSFIVLDFVTGILKAIYTKTLSSEIGYKGIIKKVCLLLVVGVAVMLETNLKVPAIREIVIMFFIANEGISILENIGQMGIDLPSKLKDILLQLKDKGDSSNDQ